MNYCDTCVIRNQAICSGLTSEELEVLDKIGRRRRLEAGETLIWEGDHSLLVANVIDGVLKLSSGTDDGREQIVGVAYPSDFVGRPFESTSGNSVTALTDAVVCVFSRSDFDAFTKDHPALEHKLLVRTLSELERTRQWVLLLGRKNAEEKIATFLLDLSQRLVPQGCEDEDTAEALELPFSRQQIADVLGLTIETVSRQLTKLKRAGVIDLPSRREIAILDRMALENRAG